ncbi:7-cyano-7-deazaguanine synthase QueC [Paraburkholderia megapolitana]|uniref:7-cyano-7-deazaguanine synthase QueC n=1 Tax=Paraburkholderia megapolitana TaxID=420953 RepID=UPI0038BD55D2
MKSKSEENHPNTHEHAIVLFSGGQDSTTCLLWALREFKRVDTVAFDYDQRNRIELSCRNDVLDKIKTLFPEDARRLGGDHLINLSFLSTIGESGLFSNANNPAPPTDMFVPGRNILFINLASILAYRNKASTIVIGVSGPESYPDSSFDFIKAMEPAINLGMDRHFTISTPLVELEKHEIWNFAHDLGGTSFIDLIRSETHTCYTGDRNTLHAWGYGCGLCRACILRRAGYEKWFDCFD